MMWAQWGAAFIVGFFDGMKHWPNGTCFSVIVPCVILLHTGFFTFIASSVAAQRAEKAESLARGQATIPAHQ